MGDGMGGMAALIDLVMLLMLVGGTTAFWFIGQRIARSRGMTSSKAWIVGLAAGAVGAGAGALLVIAVFYPTTWSPPPVIHFVPEDGRKPDWIVLLEDPSSERTIRWTGTEMPFSGVSTSISVPSGGVVRVRALGDHIAPGSAQGVLPDGSLARGQAVGPAPQGSRATSYAAWGWKAWERPEDDLPMGDAELAAWLRTREAQSSAERLAR
jgi:hypothetical protein